MYVVTEDFTPSGATPDADREGGFLTVRVGQLLEVLDPSEEGAWLALTLPQAPGEQQVEGFVNPHLLRRATPPSGDGGGHASSVADRLSTKSEHFEAETGQEVPQHTTRGSGQEEVDAPDSASSHTHSLGSEGKSTGQNLIAQQQQEPLPLPSMDLDLLTPSQTSFLSTTEESGGNPLDMPPEDDVATKEAYDPPPHADLFADEDGSDRMASFSISSMEQSSSPPPLPVPEGGSKEEGEGNGMGGPPLSMSLQSLPTSFSPTGTPVLAPHKFLGYNPMMVRTFDGRMVENIYGMG